MFKLEDCLRPQIKINHVNQKPKRGSLGLYLWVATQLNAPRRSEASVNIQEPWGRLPQDNGVENRNALAHRMHSFLLWQNQDRETSCGDLALWFLHESGSQWHPDLPHLFCHRRDVISYKTRWRSNTSLSEFIMSPRQQQQNQNVKDRSSALFQENTRGQLYDIRRRRVFLNKTKNIDYEIQRLINLTTWKFRTGIHQKTSQRQCDKTNTRLGKDICNKLIKKGLLCGIKNSKKISRKTTK